MGLHAWAGGAFPSPCGDISPASKQSKPSADPKHEKQPQATSLFPNQDPRHCFTAYPRYSPPHPSPALYPLSETSRCHIRTFNFVLGRDCGFDVVLCCAVALLHRSGRRFCGTLQGATRGFWWKDEGRLIMHAGRYAVLLEEFWNWDRGGREGEYVGFGTLRLKGVMGWYCTETGRFPRFESRLSMTGKYRPAVAYPLGRGDVMSGEDSFVLTQLGLLRIELSYQNARWRTTAPSIDSQATA